MMRIALGLLLASSAFCQNVERVFRLTHTPATTGQQEIATTLRTVARIEKLSVDTGTATITLQGSPDQIALAEWLVPRLDAGVPGAQSYNIAGNPNDIVMVNPFLNVGDLVKVQEIVTTVRTVLDFRWVYNIGTRMIAIRGTSSQIAAAGFLLPKLDQPMEPRQVAKAEHFHMSETIRGVDTLSVYSLGTARGALAVQEIITSLRLLADIQKVYNVTSTATLTLEASQSGIEVAEWLIARLDRQGPDPASSELKLPGGKDDVLHVFYLSHITAGKEIGKLSKTIVPAAPPLKAFSITVPPAIVVRGTADSVALAGRLIAQADNPK